MTPEQINIAIAEARGWIRLESDQIGWKHVVDGTARSFVCFWDELPNYYGSRDAMAEAEGWLESSGHTDTLCMNYLENLWLACGDEAYCKVKTVAFATAAQRAEAFLRTIGKWKEE